MSVPEDREILELLDDVERTLTPEQREAVRQGAANIVSDQLRQLEEL